MALYIGCADVDDVYAHLRGRGLKAGPPHGTSYGMREVSVRDPDGFTLHFLSPAEVAAAAEGDADDTTARRSAATSRGESRIPRIPVEDIAAAAAY